MKHFYKDEKAQGGMVGFFITALVTLIIALQVTLPVADSVINDLPGTATGTITFTGTAVAGETVNISSETYTLTNGTGGAFNVNIGAGTANASYTTSQLVAELTANSTLVTAVNNGDNSSTVTAILSGSAGNYATTTNVTGGSWGAATLTGGSNTVTGNQSATSQALLGLIPLFIVLLVVLIFVRPLL